MSAEQLNPEQSEIGQSACPKCAAKGYLVCWCRMSRSYCDTLPRFEHDCEKCAFLGSAATFDAYACLQGGDMPTIVLRWGDKPEEYRSALQMFDRLTPELQDAARRWLLDDPDVRAILKILKDAGGELPYEHLEHRFHQGQGR